MRLIVSVSFTTWIKMYIPSILHCFLLVWSWFAAISLHNSVQCLWMEPLYVGLLRHFLVWWLWLLCVCGRPLRSCRLSSLCGVGSTGQCSLFLCSNRDCLFAEFISSHTLDCMVNQYLFLTTGMTGFFIACDYTLL